MSTLTYVILDLETDGADREQDGDILEIAAVGLDENLNEVFRYSTPIQQPLVGGRFVIGNMPPVVHVMHTESGLIADIEAQATALEHPLLDETDESGLFIHPYITHADELLAAVIASHTEDTLILAGSGVSHYDFRWVKYHMPLTAARFKWYTIDVGCMRRLYRAVVGDDLTNADSRKTHRALDDVDCHLEELREFAALFIRDALIRDYVFAEPGEADCE